MNRRLIPSPNLLSLSLVLLSLAVSASLAGEADDWFKQGKAAIEKGDFDTAIAHFSQAAIWAPKDAKIRYFRGVAFWDKGILDKASNDFAAAIELNPQYVDAYIGRGATYGEKGDFTNALGDFDEAVRLAP